jgi:hypothetical protein
MNILIGLIIMAVGAFLAMKSEWMLNNFGRINWFEEHLGSEGGSRLGYKLIGMLAIFLGILFATSMISDFMQWILSPLLSVSQSMK